MIDALMKKCDALDGAADGMIFDPLGCHFDPEEIASKPGQREGCLAPEKAAAIRKAFAGPKNAYGTQVYPGFLYDAGIAASGPLAGTAESAFSRTLRIRHNGDHLSSFVCR